ncbi:unnamed protein product [Brassicogethes aeneus]|uniref:STAR protein homodimerisation region domain-containing protein n=1 Tax=Brassicogethes aeneus TaxID=1431903 RepID=A0A9P0B2I9_BRAAE|nr:unnamed protein product [Brassicogethes aeneus]
MCDQTAASTQSIADYLAQLLKDRKQLAAFPNVFIHVERLLDEGLKRRGFQQSGAEIVLTCSCCLFSLRLVSAVAKGGNLSSGRHGLAGEQQCQQEFWAFSGKLLLKFC